MIRRLRVKFVCVNMAIAAALLAALFALALHFTRESLEAESLRVLAAAARDPLAPERGDARPLPYFALQIWPDGGRLIAGGGYWELTQDTLLELVAAALETGEDAGVLPDYALRFRRLEAPYVGFAFVDISGEAAALNHLVRSGLVMGGVGLAAFLLVSLALARWAVRPVEEAWRRQRQFVSDASHELKTPLTVILTNAELLQSRGEDPVQRSRYTENLLAMSRQMRSLVENLLDLARVDGGVIRGLLEPVDFSHLAEEALLPFEPVFFEAGLELASRIEADVAVRGSAIHLRQAVDILLDNARKYGRERVAVALERSGGRGCLLSVATPGEPIGEADLENIFRRFYRRDSARSHGGGYGLGLPIARGIVESHGGRIWAESAGGVNTFYIRLPRLLNGMGSGS